MEKEREIVYKLDKIIEVISGDPMRGTSGVLGDVKEIKHKQAEMETRQVEVQAEIQRIHNAVPLLLKKKERDAWLKGAGVGTGITGIGAFTMSKTGIIKGVVIFFKSLFSTLPFK